MENGKDDHDVADGADDENEAAINGENGSEKVILSLVRAEVHLEAGGKASSELWTKINYMLTIFSNFIFVFSKSWKQLWYGPIESVEDRRECPNQIVMR